MASIQSLTRAHTVFCQVQGGNQVSHVSLSGMHIVGNKLVIERVKVKLKCLFKLLDGCLNLTQSTTRPAARYLTAKHVSGIDLKTLFKICN